MPMGKQNQPPPGPRQRKSDMCRNSCPWWSLLLQQQFPGRLLLPRAAFLQAGSLPLVTPVS